MTATTATGPLVPRIPVSSGATEGSEVLEATATQEALEGSETAGKAAGRLVPQIPADREERASWVALGVQEAPVAPEGSATEEMVETYTCSSPPHCIFNLSVKTRLSSGAV